MNRKLRIWYADISYYKRLKVENTEIKDIISMEEESLTIFQVEQLIKDEIVRDKLYNNFPDDFYRLIMRTITHETYENEIEAEKIFTKIKKHMNDLNNVLKRDVGIVVAAVDYLRNIEGSLSEPKIIEEKKSVILINTSTRDELTNLYLRDIFDISIKKAVSESKRNNSPLSVLFIDIDDFKKVNDTYGHQEGDTVLRSIGKVINNSIREMDLAARYGGEELVVLLPKATIKEAKQTAQRIRKNIESLDFKKFKVTVSIGLSQLNDKITDGLKLVESADFALYEAKKNGKNRVEIFTHYDK